jgi:hypothetical protein
MVARPHRPPVDPFDSPVPFDQALRSSAAPD